MTAGEERQLGVLIGTVKGQGDQLAEIKTAMLALGCKLDTLSHNGTSGNAVLAREFHDAQKDVVKRADYDQLQIRVKVLEDDSVADTAIAAMHRWLIVTGIALVGVASGVLFNFLRATYSSMTG